MPQLPENIRPAVALLVKHHFWLLAILAPLVLLPLVFLARGRLQTEIMAAQAKIRGKFDALQAVRGVNPHPNEGWSTEINAEAGRIRADTLAEWKKFWDSQEFLRVWPQELGDKFLQDVSRLKPEGILDRNNVARYQNTIPEVVKKLPGRMGADDAMSEERRAGPQAVAGRNRPSGSLVVWSAEDQGRLADCFNWKRLPASPQAATTQVLLAQEELWVYGLFCDVIKRANKDATGEHNAVIVRVDRLSVGYPAAEPQPGGTGGNRIVLPKDAAAPAAEPASAGPGAAGGGAKPSHPRFGGGDGPAVGRDMNPPMDGSAASQADASLREWIYVDFEGKPLSAADLTTSPAARTVHLMPFVLRITIDQRRLDALLVDLAGQPVPIDVREVRINAGRERAGAQAAAAPAGAAAKADRRLDVQVELRGTVGIATRPNPVAIGVEPQGQPPATDAAAHPAGATRRPPVRSRETAA
jgi:hypothetical protein